MITSPKTSAIPTVPSVPGCSASVTIAPQPAKTSAKVPIASAAARRGRFGLSPMRCSAAGSGGGEDLAHRVEGAGDEAEVAAGAAALARDQARLDQLLQ